MITPLLSRALTLVALALSVALPARRALAQLVFAGDPVDPATGQAYSILPGVPLVYPGPDGKFGNADDLIDATRVGDLDLVARTAPLLGGAIIPAPAPGVGAAPTVVAGGLLGGGGSQAPFFLVFSDGATLPAAGHALLGPELDLRRALVVAYADLDGDGFIGPTAATTAAELEIRRQEALTFAGRTMAEFSGGVASGQLGVGLALPASAGGLGIVIGAGAATGATPNLYSDGPWATTLLPYMIPLDQGAVVGGEPTGPVDALSLVDLELSGSSVYLPAPNDPRLGTPYAIPLDGSSLSVDLLRSVSGALAGAGFARALDRAAFVAQWAQVIRPVIGPLGERLLVEPLEAMAIAADATASVQTVTVFPADLFGNAADPPAGGQAMVFEVGPALRIVAPDTDHDPRRETVVFASPRAVTLTLDDSGVEGSDALLASCAGVPCGALAVTIGAGGSAAPPFTRLAVRMRRLDQVGRGVLATTMQVPPPGATLDPTAQVLSLVLRDASGVLYQRTLPPGAIAASSGGRRLSFRDADTVLTMRRSGRAGSALALTLRAAGLSLASGSAPATLRLEIGAAAWQDSRVCAGNGAAVRRCGP